MSIVVERIETSGFGPVIKCEWDSSRFESTPTKKEGQEDDYFRRNSSLNTTSSSSIGSDSDAEVSGISSEGGDSDENEVQSSYKGGLNMMNSLEKVLPMRRGISSFYNGKSKSFTSLAEGSPNTIKEIAKPENAYSRRRRNLLAINHVWDRNRNKRIISSSKSSLAFAMAVSSSESISSNTDESSSTSSPRTLPPLHPQSKAFLGNVSSAPPSIGRNLSNWRSFSMADVREYKSTLN